MPTSERSVGYNYALGLPFTNEAPASRFPSSRPTGVQRDPQVARNLHGKRKEQHDAKKKKNGQGEASQTHTWKEKTL